MRLESFRRAESQFNCENFSKKTEQRLPFRVTTQASALTSPKPNLKPKTRLRFPTCQCRCPNPRAAYFSGT